MQSSICKCRGLRAWVRVQIRTVQQQISDISNAHNTIVLGLSPNSVGFESQWVFWTSPGLLCRIYPQFEVRALYLFLYSSRTSVVRGPSFICSTSIVCDGVISVIWGLSSVTYASWGCTHCSRFGLYDIYFTRLYTQLEVWALYSPFAFKVGLLIQIQLSVRDRLIHTWPFVTLVYCWAYGSRRAFRVKLDSILHLRTYLSCMVLFNIACFCLVSILWYFS